MTAATRSLIASTANPLLERALRDKLARRSADIGSLGELEPLALRIGLMQNSLKPQMVYPHLVIVASDHGLAVDGIVIPEGHSTADDVRRILTRQMPVSVFAHIQGMALTVIDAGIADRVAPHDGLVSRKIAHGTRNTRLGLAMTLDQAQAGIRAGMEIGGTLPGDAMACAGLGVGGPISAALVLARLTGVSVRDLLVTNAKMDAADLTRMMVLAQSAQTRHRDVSDPIEVLAAFGGFEMAVMVGLMLTAAQRRNLVIVDGMAACAALMVASRIAPTVTDYCIFCRSQQHQGLDYTFNLFHAGALLELGMNSIDGTGSAIAWPLVRSAVALLSELVEGEDPGPTRPDDGTLSLATPLEAVPVSDEAVLLALGGTAGRGVSPAPMPPSTQLARDPPRDMAWRSALIDLQHVAPLKSGKQDAARDSEPPTRF